MKKGKGVLLLLLLAAVVAFWWWDLGQWLNLASIKAGQQAWQQQVQAAPVLMSLAFVAIYVAVTALSLPGAALLTLLAGGLFGLWWGTLLVSIASTLGATLAFLAARYLLRDTLTRRFQRQMQAIDSGIQREGAWYLFGLRMVPLFPFFMINLLMGVTSMRVWTYMWVSQLGMLAGTLVYVNAGTQLAQLDSLRGILSPNLLGAFVLLGVFPLLAKALMARLQRKRLYQGFSQPEQFDYNLVAIGAGSAGLVTTYIGAAVQAKVALVEKHRMGGDCLNTGCVPSKALIRSARFVAECQRARELGMQSAEAQFDFAEVMERVQQVIKEVEPHDSVERYSSLGVECIQGEARITSPWTVEVNGRTLRTRNIVIATGARPFVPEITGIEQVQPLTSDTVWNLRELPKRLLVLGGGPIGCELAQCFARLGSQVIQVERNSRLQHREDEEVSALVEQRFREEGIELHLQAEVVAFRVQEGEKQALLQSQGQQQWLGFDQVLVVLGRRANVKGFGLEELGIEAGPRGTLEVDEYLRTRLPNILACGDVVGPYQFTHAASHQAWYASVNALFAGIKAFKVDYRVIPHATFTEPEVARVGLNEQEAKAQGIAYEVSQFDIAELDRAIADSARHGFIKVLTVPGKDKILGVTLVGEHAGDLIAEFVLAMRYNLGLNKILGTIHIYPTLAESNKYVAGVWKRAHAPARILAWLARFHRWRRGA
ncbi:FAD-dependent oxidoreductase [Balneatrix alpica]|uniref:FAD-dependent oxidoreductase n=1 Tax=Balneatrix alpica TaxID=75684 RepID=A0ABV5Z944_9GAMM|nr:FAD-dependent oxidoreductase [Balneatrix alpica]